MSLYGIIQKTTLERIKLDWGTPDIISDFHDYWGTPDIISDFHDYWGELERTSRNYGQNYIFEEGIIHDFKLHYKSSYLCIALYTFKRNINLTRLHVI